MDIGGKVRGNGGFSLVEVMVVMGLMGIISLGMASMVNNMAKQNAKQNNMNDVQSIVNMGNGILSNQSSCQKAFAGQHYDYANPSFPKSLDGNGFTFSGSEFKKGAQWGNVKISSIQWVGPDSDLGTSSITLAGGPVSVSTRGAILEIQVLPVNAALSQVPITRKLDFILSVDSSKTIQSCFSTIDAKAVCSQMGGAQVNGVCDVPLAMTNVDIVPGSSCSRDGQSAFRKGVGLFVCAGGSWQLIPTKSQCENQGGAVVISGAGTKVCRFFTDKCPSGTSAVPAWSTTSPVSCTGPRNWCGKTATCTTASHDDFRNQGTETCAIRKLGGCTGLTGWTVGTCYAKITSVGCTMPPEP